MRPFEKCPVCGGVIEEKEVEKLSEVAFAQLP